jgi:hypothetical protein
VAYRRRLRLAWPGRLQAVRMTAALIDQFCASFPTPLAEFTLEQR